MSREKSCFCKHEERLPTLKELKAYSKKLESMGEVSKGRSTSETATEIINNKKQ